MKVHGNIFWTIKYVQFDLMGHLYELSQSINLKTFLIIIYINLPFLKIIFFLWIIKLFYIL